MTILVLAAGLGLFSLILTVFYWICERVNTNHSQRLWLLKFGVLLIILTIPVTLVLRSLIKSEAVGKLLAGSIRLLNVVSKSKPLAFTNGEVSHTAEIVAGIYLFGVFLMLAILVASFLRSKKLLGESKQVDIDGHKVFVSERAQSPLSFGFISPRIYVPTDLLQKYDSKAISLALAHEEIHILNHDHHWKFASLLSRAILFFAPTMSYLHSKLELEMEIECDRSTMQRTGATIQEYGTLLIGFADAMIERQTYSAFVYMSDTTLRKRIVAMKTKMVRRPILAFTMSFAILAVAGGTATVVSGANKISSQFKVKTQFVIGGKVVSSPQFVIIPNEPASLNVKSEHSGAALRMTLAAQDSTDPQVANGIHLKMAVDYRGEGRVVRASPQVIVFPGKEALVILNSDSNEAVEIHIVAERQ